MAFGGARAQVITEFSDGIAAPARNRTTSRSEPMATSGSPSSMAAIRSGGLHRSVTSPSSRSAYHSGRASLTASRRGLTAICSSPNRARTSTSIRSGASRPLRRHYRVRLWHQRVRCAHFLHNWAGRKRVVHGTRDQPRRTNHADRKRHRVQRGHLYAGNLCPPIRRKPCQHHAGPGYGNLWFTEASSDRIGRIYARQSW